MALLDVLDALPRSAVRQRVWRTVREGRDPLEGRKSRGRWGHDGMETLYTSYEEQGSVAEIHALLSLQPVFPSKVQWSTHEVQAELENVASLTLRELAELGVEIEKYRSREYERTQEIADAALFLGFSGLIVPSARWECPNLVVFTEKIEPGQLTLVGSPNRVDWEEWREQVRRTRIRSEAANRPRGINGTVRSSAEYCHFPKTAQHADRQRRSPTREAPEVAGGRGGEKHPLVATRRVARIGIH